MQESRVGWDAPRQAPGQRRPSVAEAQQEHERWARVSYGSTPVLLLASAASIVFDAPLWVAVATLLPLIVFQAALVVILVKTKGRLAVAKKRAARAVSATEPSAHDG